MSGRIRSVKPEWLEDELLALASDAARVMTIGLLLQADDYGNGRANPVLLAGQVFPGKVPEHATKALEELRSIRFVTLYEVDGQRYFHIRNWDKHQRVDKPGKPRVPPPPAEISAVSHPLPASPALSSEPLAKVPETPANVPASRASDPDPDPDPDPIPGPGPGPGRARDIQALATAYLRDEFTGSNGGIGGGVASSWPEVLAVCAAFQRAWSKQVTLRAIGLKDPRLKVILERFAEGFTVSQLEQALTNAKHADYIASNQAHQTLQTILRDAGQVEKFGALTRAPVAHRLDPRNEAQDRNADHDTRERLEASRRVRAELERFDRMKAGGNV